MRTHLIAHAAVPPFDAEIRRVVSDGERKLARSTDGSAGRVRVCNDEGIVYRQIDVSGVDELMFLVRTLAECGYAVSYPRRSFRGQGCDVLVER
ncbi:MAG TPA: hypothetical protein VJM11_06815 [Nevskiaceae bacterium]|nr:hypothetical protein [Nevskiaceae bacterium]